MVFALFRDLGTHLAYERLGTAKYTGIFAIWDFSTALNTSIFHIFCALVSGTGIMINVAGVTWEGGKVAEMRATVNFHRDL